MSSGAINEGLLPNWHVVDGLPCQWRLVTILDPGAATFGLAWEIWKKPVQAAPPRWCSLAESTLLLNSDQTQTLLELLARHLGMNTP